MAVCLCDSIKNMEKTDAELMGASLIAVADAGVELRFALFERFLPPGPNDGRLS
jgi:hypothetical protein